MKALGKLLALAGVLGGGAYIYRYVQLISKLKYNIGQVRLEYFSLSNTQLSADLIIQNEGWFSLNVDRLIVDVYFDGSFVGKLTDSQPFMLLPASTTVVQSNINLDPTSFGGEISKLLSFKENTSENSTFGNINVKFEGKLTTKAYGIPFSVPFVYTDTLKNLTT